jgi:hypothetical protein
MDIAGDESDDDVPAAVAVGVTVAASAAAPVVAVAAGADDVVVVVAVVTVAALPPLTAGAVDDGMTSTTLEFDPDRALDARGAGGRLIMYERSTPEVVKGASDDMSVGVARDDDAALSEAAPAPIGVSERGGRALPGSKLSR